MDVKRKPAPSFDGHVLSTARYPPLDPHDPFAPLDILRGRLSSSSHPPHYRQRSQSNPPAIFRSFTPPPSHPRFHYPTPSPPTPSIVTSDDSSTHTLTDDTPISIPFPSKPSRFENSENSLSSAGSHKHRRSSAFFVLTPDVTPDTLYRTASPSHLRLPSIDAQVCASGDAARGYRASGRAVLRRKNPRPSSPVFDQTVLPTLQQLADAASIDVIAENGLRTSFGQLFLEKKTVVCFIRHFWCPNCQDYMYSISRNVNPKILRRAGVNLVIIGNGSHNMIKSYREIFRTTLPVYTDPTNRLYATLGMTLRSLSPGPDSERGIYVRHGVVRGAAMVVANAIKNRMPILEYGGDMSQLGGEFVLGPGLQCTYAHRMNTTRSHAPIARVLKAAGVNLYTSVENASLSVLGMSEEEKESWMRERQESLNILSARKACRRRGTLLCQSFVAGDLEITAAAAASPEKEKSALLVDEESDVDWSSSDASGTSGSESSTLSVESAR